MATPNIETIAIECFESMDEAVRTVFMGVSTLLAVFSFVSTVRLWKKANRPIVSAFIEVNTAGNVGITYNVVVINSGNRPAVNIYLSLELSNKDFQEFITQEMNDIRVQEILQCFKSDGIIPLLINGEKTSNAFGMTSERPDQNLWKFGSSLPIRIRYQDLEGNTYTSKLNLVVKYSKAFAGTEWSKPVTKKM